MLALTCRGDNRPVVVSSASLSLLSASFLLLVALSSLQI